MRVAVGMTSQWCLHWRALLPAAVVPASAFAQAELPPDKITIAKHGSGNRRKRMGYRFSLATLDGNKAVGNETFVKGWSQGDSPWGRRVDVLDAPEGSLLVFDDRADL